MPDSPHQILGVGLEANDQDHRNEGQERHRARWIEGQEAREAHPHGRDEDRRGDRGSEDEDHGR